MKSHLQRYRTAYVADLLERGQAVEGVSEAQIRCAARPGAALGVLAGAAGLRGAAGAGLRGDRFSRASGRACWRSARRRASRALLEKRRGGGSAPPSTGRRRPLDASLESGGRSPEPPAQRMRSLPLPATLAPGDIIAAALQLMPPSTSPGDASSGTECGPSGSQSQGEEAEVAGGAAPPAAAVGGSVAVPGTEDRSQQTGYLQTAGSLPAPALPRAAPQQHAPRALPGGQAAQGRIQLAPAPVKPEQADAHSSAWAVSAVPAVPALHALCSALLSAAAAAACMLKHQCWGAQIGRPLHLTFVCPAPMPPCCRR